MAQSNRELSQFSSFLEVDNLNKNISITTGPTPYVGIGTTNPTAKLTVQGDVLVSDILTASHIVGTSLSISGISTLGVTSTTNLISQQLNVSGILTASHIVGTSLSISGISTFTNGSILIGAATSTGTTSQPLQVTGGAYVSGNLGIGTTNPTEKLHVVGDTNVSGIISATGYYLNGNSLVDAAIQTWDINGSDVYRLTGNVGIGSSIPGAKLTVVGDITATGVITGSDLSVTGPITGSDLSVIGIATASTFTSTVESGTAPLTVNSTSQVFNLNASLLAGKTPPAGDIVGTTDNQVLTNKTLTSPVISSIVNGAFTSNVPSVNGTLVSTGSTGTVTSNMIADLNIVNADVAVGAGIVYGKLSLTNSIVNADVAVGAGITYGKLSLTGSITNADINASAGISVSKLSASTISGITLGSNLATLTFGTYLTGTSYNGSTAVTIGINASTSGNSNIVARDGSGNFSAGTITATDFNSTSDINLKENIKTIENSLDTLTQLRGVSFDWKETGRSSYGVIAQELEEILPDLINTGEVKSVNYNGIIGVLIEAVKELSEELKELRNTK